MKLAELIETYNLQMTVKPIDSRPDGLMDMDKASHWKLRLMAGHFEPMKRGTMARWKQDRGFNLYYSMGSAIVGEPKIEDVLNCLASDASGYENAQGFEDWAVEYGYEPDSRKAEKIYKIVKRQAEQLKRTIGSDAYETLLREVERD